MLLGVSQVLKVYWVFMFLVYKELSRRRRQRVVIEDRSVTPE